MNKMMNKKTKPILHSGFCLNESTTIDHRIEKIFFTEIYLLSNKQYYYLFTDIEMDDIVRKGRYDILPVKVKEKEYPGIIFSENLSIKISDIKNELTQLRGFDSVAGMNDLKQELHDDVIGPLLNPEKYKKFKVSIPNGILLYGPPGCGKTFIIKKLAEELDYDFFEIKHSDVASSYIHGSVSKIAKLFDMAKLKAPCVIFIDEIEGLVPKRENLSSTSDHKQEEVNEFLMHLNKAGNDSQILIVGATNRPELIDTAILRSGRMDKRIYIKAPDLQARRDLFKIYLLDRPHSASIDFDKLALMTENYVSSDIELITMGAAREAVKRNLDEINEDLLIEIITNVPPSITEEDLTYYDNFKDLERT